MKDKKILNTSCDDSLDIDDLKKRLIEENDFLTKLVDTIPAKMYFEYDIQQKITAEKHSAMDETAAGSIRHFFFLYIFISEI